MNNDKNPKTKKNKFVKGKVCPKCHKGRLEKSACAKVNSDGHSHHVECKTCGTSNY